MKKHFLTRRKNLYLKDTKTKGRGVFCTEKIKKGEILEVTPALILNEAATLHADKTILCDYTFSLGKITRAQRQKAKIRDTGNASVVIMGITAFCNHDEKPNAVVEWEEIGGTLYYQLRATRDIPKDTEICTTYGDGWFDDRK